MQINFESKKTTELDGNTILKICKLKNKHWKFNLKNQILWFNKYIKKKDIHNLCFLNKKLIGYTSLRQGYYNFTKNGKKKSFLLFDTLVLDPEHRKQKLGILMMKFNNLIILKKKKPSFLVCKMSLVKFYRSSGWKLLAKNKFLTNYKLLRLKGMTYLFNEKNKNKIFFNLYE